MAVSVDEIELSRKNLTLIHQYMESHNYSRLDIVSPYNLKQVTEMINDLIEDVQLLKKTLRKKDWLEGALVLSNKGLIIDVMKKYGLPEEMFSKGEEFLIISLQKFDLSRHCKFSSFAYEVIRHGFQNEKKEQEAKKRGKHYKHISLEEPFTEGGGTLKEITEDENSLKPDENL
ncbi:hypothetical protein KY366_05295 [Candidatus Woesearchaeota archaeon]|nr:hypothetical protein [Candidatus Woesearchaeota archaeon]